MLNTYPFKCCQPSVDQIKFILDAFCNNVQAMNQACDMNHVRVKNFQQPARFHHVRCPIRQEQGEIFPSMFYSKEGNCKYLKIFSLNKI